MKNNILYTLLVSILLLLGQTTYAQKFNVKGQVVNANNSPVEFVDVTLLGSDSLFVTATPTDSLGRFSINAIKGNYILQFKQFGSLLLNRSISLSQNVNLGEVEVNESILLDELMVYGKKQVIEKKVDRLVFSVENVVSLGGGNALDALQKTPRVKVQNEGISMVGKSDMLVMVNNRIVQLNGSDLTSYLKSINSDDIKSIEVIPNPPAKYVADGNSGIINIITKSRKGESSWSSTLRSSYNQSSYATGSYGGNLNFQNSKWQVNSSVDYIKGSANAQENSTIYYPTETWENRSTRRDYSDNLSARLGVNYTINTSLSTGFSYNYINNDPSVNEKERVDIEETNRYMNTVGNMNLDKEIHNFNYNLVYKLDDLGKKLSFDVDFFDYKNTSRQNYLTHAIETSEQDNSASEADNYGNQKIRNYSFNLDMEHPTKWVNLNYGARYAETNTRNILELTELTVFEQKPTKEVFLKDNFRYRERTQSIYLSGQKRFSDKWEAKLGLRFEASQTRGVSDSENQTNRHSYSELFPTLYIAYTLNENHSLNLNYGRRIGRPGFSSLNPFRWASNPYSYSQGNPDLRPVFINNIELEYSYKDKLITNIYYSHSSNGFEQVSILDEATKIEKLTPLNYLSTDLIGISQTIMISPFRWWDLYANLDVYYSYSNSNITVTQPQLSGWNGLFSVSNDFSLRRQKDLYLNIGFDYGTKGVDGMSRNTSYSELTAAIKWKTLKDKLILTLSGTDILNTVHPIYTSYSNSIKSEYKNYYDRQSIRLSLAFNFGKKIDSQRSSNKNMQEYNRLD